MPQASVDTNYIGEAEYQRNTAKNLRNTNRGNANGDVVDNSESITAGRVILTSPQQLMNLRQPSMSLAYPTRSDSPPDF